MAAKIKSLQMWCKRQCEGYRDVQITNMTSSWKSGLAFCAIIHRYRPDLIDYDSLSKENVLENNKLAFDVGQDQLNIPALLDPEDMVTMTVPDKLCIVTYVSQYYTAFCNMDPTGGPDVRQFRTTAKRTLSANHATAPDAKKITPTKPVLSDQNDQVTKNTSKNGHQGAAPVRKGTYGDTCHICGRKVYLMERHIEDSKLFHRRCIRDQQKSLRSPTRSQHAPTAFQWPTKASNSKQPTKNIEKPSTEDQGAPEQSKSMHIIDQLPSGQINKRSGISDSKTRSSGFDKDVLSSKAAQNVPQRSEAPDNRPASLVKMLYGSPAPYSGSACSDTQKVSTDDHVKQTVNSNILRPVPKDRPAGSTNTTKQGRRPLSIRERASMFNNGPTGELKAISHGTKPAFTLSKPSAPATFSQVKPELDTLTYTYHTGVVSSDTHPTASSGPAKVSLHTGLLSSLATIRKQKSQDDDSAPVANNDAVAAEDCKPETSGSFLGYKSALINDDSSKVDSSGMSMETTVSILKSRVTEGQGPQSADSNSQKSILKQSSPRHSFDAAAHNETSLKTILKHRFSDEINPRGAEDHPKTILKSRKSSDEFEPLFGSPTNPRPILKSVSPPDSSRSRSTSPPKSILKSRETSPESGHKPAKSILKTRDSVEDMDIDDSLSISDSKPRSILKHSQDDGSVPKDERVSSPNRSILKHSPSNEHNEPRSILRGETDLHTDIPGKEHQDPDHRDRNQTVSNHDVCRPSTETLQPSPRAQIKISLKTPQPAPRLHSDKNNLQSHRTKPDRPDQPLSLGKCQSAAKTDSVTRVQPYHKGRPASPKSILRTRHEMSDPVSTKSGSSSQMGRRGKDMPEAGKSSGTPSVSVSQSKPHGNAERNGISPHTDAVNNFSAFNLSDSLFIHGKTDSMGNDINKAPINGNNLPPKSAWQREVEAKKANQQADVKSKAPARPAASPRCQKPQSGNPGATKAPPAGEDINKPSWQLEAEKRKAIRNGKYEDPEFRRVNNARNKKIELAKDNNLVDVKVNGKVHNGRSSNDDSNSSLFTKLHEQFRPPVVQPDNKPLSPPPRPPPLRTAPPPPTSVTNQSEHTSPPIPQRPATKHQYEKIWESPTSQSPASPTNSKANLNRSPAFRIADSPQSSPESNRPHRDETSDSKRKILPDTDFSFKSAEFEFNLNDPQQRSGLSSPQLPVSANVSDAAQPVSDWIQRRPLPTPPGKDKSPPKRFVNAEARVGTLKIVRDLEDLDKQLRALEEEGRAMEDKIRAVSEDDMDEDLLMAEWFEMISKKNNLVRKESELMYRQRQQELEDLHMDLEYELRLLMEKPERERTASDKVRENTLIQELLETVNLRNHIVDSMEADRIRYMEEDQEIAEMMVKTGLITSPSSEGKKKKKFDKKKHSKDDHHLRTKAGARDRKVFRLTIG